LERKPTQEKSKINLPVKDKISDIARIKCAIGAQKKGSIKDIYSGIFCLFFRQSGEKAPITLLIPTFPQFFTTLSTGTVKTTGTRLSIKLFPSV
jgi:hypothetical protein